ncbi:MAG: outer membrane lipoprotein carrier protein LolA [Spirochaetales bacterium]|nr:outer membrane lipoprotein carrier protein LolA [Spirochaetales bacterium]
MIKIRFYTGLILLLCLPHIIFAQDITTASDFFEQVSDRYREIVDYQASLTMTQTDSVMSGMLFHKRPNYLLIEFAVPEEQVVAVDGEKLIIYIPRFNAALEQPLKKSEEPAAGLATAQGLDLMSNRYSIAYLESQDPVPLEEESEELVIQLKLEWRSIDEGFRQLTLSINEDLMIRRISGVTSNFQEIQLDFLDILTNQNIPEGKFRYESPPSANIINNFIFPPEEEQ